jgi:hypothetical protein
VASSEDETSLVVPEPAISILVEGSKVMVEMTLSTLTELAKAAVGEDADLAGEQRSVSPYFVRCEDGFLLVLKIARAGISYRVPLPFGKDVIDRYAELRVAWEASADVRPVRTLDAEMVAYTGEPE